VLCNQDVQEAYHGAASKCIFLGAAFDFGRDAVKCYCRLTEHMLYQKQHAPFFFYSYSPIPGHPGHQTVELFGEMVFLLIFARKQMVDTREKR